MDVLKPISSAELIERFGVNASGLSRWRRDGWLPVSGPSGTGNRASWHPATLRLIPWIQACCPVNEADKTARIFRRRAEALCALVVAQPKIEWFLATNETVEPLTWAQAVEVAVTQDPACRTLIHLPLAERTEVASCPAE